MSNTLGTFRDHIRNVKKMKKNPPFGPPPPKTGKKKTRASSHYVESFHWLHGEYGHIFIFELIELVGNLWLCHSSHPERSVKLYCLLGCFLVRLHKALFS
jgi:hypothetical protein